MFGSMVIVTSQAAPISSKLDASVAPNALAEAIAAGDKSMASNTRPAWTNRLAIGNPMRPRPMKPIRRSLSLSKAFHHYLLVPCFLVRMVRLCCARDLEVS